MQTIGYINYQGEKILLLVRQNSYYRSLKIRKSGKDGTHFTDEEIYLCNDCELVDALKKGMVIGI